MNEAEKRTWLPSSRSPPSPTCPLRFPEIPPPSDLSSPTRPESPLSGSSHPASPDTGSDTQMRHPRGTSLRDEPCIPHPTPAFCADPPRHCAHLVNRRRPAEPGTPIVSLQDDVVTQSIPLAAPAAPRLIRDGLPLAPHVFSFTATVLT